MIESPSAQDKIQKLEQVIQKGDAFATQLERQGLDISPVRGKLDSAREFFKTGEHQKAYSLIQEFIGDLNRLKDTLNKDKGNASKKGKGVFALIRDANQMDQKISEWKAIVSEWREKGYKLEKDDGLFSHPFEEVERRFVSLGEQIEKAERIRDTIADLRANHSEVGGGYRKKIDNIEKEVFKLGKLDDLDRRIGQLRGILKSVDGRYRALRNRLQRYKRKGLITHSLEEMIDNDDDLDYLEKQFNIYEGNVDYLLKEKQKFLDIKSSPVSSSISSQLRDLESMIDDPWMLDTIVERMLSLEKEIGAIKDREKRLVEESKRRAEIKESLRRYRVEGYKVEMVEQLLNEDMNLLEEEYDIFVRNLAKLKSLKERLFSMDATDFEDDLAQIFESMNDPTNMEVIDHQIKELKERIKAHRIRTQNIESTIKQWKGMGFTINQLEDMFDKKDLDSTEKLIELYDDRIKQLLDIEAKLKSQNVKEISDSVHKVLLKLKNPELYESVIREYSEIEGQIQEYEGMREKRKELNDLLKVWRGQGYEIEGILSQMRQAKTVENLQDIMLKYTRSIATLETFKKEFQTEIRGWFKTDETFIAENLDKPDMTSEVMEVFQNLKEKNAKEEQRRGVICRKLDEIDSKGIDTSKIRSYLTTDTDYLNSEYEIFKELVKRLIKLKAGLLRDAYKKKDDDLKAKANSFNDPYMVDEYESEISGKKMPAENKDGTTKREIDELLEKARSSYKAGRMMESLGFFDAVLNIDQKNKEASFYKKKILMKLKQTPEEEKKKDTKEKERPSEDKVEEAPVKKAGDPNCISCSGTGECSWCKGTGKCSTCNGTGKYFGDTCTSCKGSGTCNVCDGKGRCSWCSM
ncbi:MAG: hypothetical protein QCI82_01590 [Candidatus Thermoplasmatota archaeon]|nr:hypothetical protein [Candidatus Thermoplasmatota archaeon]